MKYEESVFVSNPVEGSQSCVESYAVRIDQARSIISSGMLSELRDIVIEILKRMSEEIPGLIVNSVIHGGSNEFKTAIEVSNYSLLGKDEVEVHSRESAASMYRHILCLTISDYLAMRMSSPTFRVYVEAPDEFSEVSDDTVIVRIKLFENDSDIDLG